MSPPQKKIFAFFVAINHYPEEVPSLRGCENDYRYFRQFLADYCHKTGHLFYDKELVNEDATRAAIINGFSHFDDARDGDICLFYFSGHGARKKAPTAFHYYEADQKMGSIVCYDSRPAGYDLLDKELAYLLWNAKKEKDIHLLVIMDCCYADNNTRSREELPDDSIRFRSIPGREDPRPIEEYLGYESYREISPGNWSPPRACYVQLSASESHQKAKEAFIDYKNRGVFSYALLQALSQRGTGLSYLDLMKRVKMNMLNTADDQSPVLWASTPKDKERHFLNGTFGALRNQYTIAYQSKNGWCINGGQLHGFIGSAQGLPSRFKILDLDHEVQIKSAGVIISTIDDIPDILDERKTYDVLLVFGGRPAVMVDFAPEIEAAGKQAFLKYYENYSTWGVRLVQEELPGTLHYLHAENGYLYLSRLPEGPPLFKPVKGYDTGAIADFLEKISVLGNWLFVKHLQNHRSKLFTNEIALSFWRTTQAGMDEDHDPAELMPLDTALQADLPYLFDDEYRKWSPPAFRLKVENMGNRRLCISALLLGYNFGVTNCLLPRQFLNPGEFVWLLQKHKHHTYQTIRLGLDDHYSKAGVTQAYDYLKIIVSPRPLDTDELNRTGLEFSGRTSPFRSDSSASEEPEDWYAIDIPLQLFRPMEWTSFHSRQAFHCGALSMDAPEGFTALIRSGSIKEWRRALDLDAVRSAASDQTFNPWVFHDPFFYSSGLSVIEMVADEPYSSLELPNNDALIITFEDTFKHGFYPIPMSWDFTNKRYTPLFHQWQNRKLYLYQLPEPTNTYPPSGQLSTKLIFHQPQ